MNGTAASGRSGNPGGSGSVDRSGAIGHNHGAVDRGRRTERLGSPVGRRGGSEHRGGAAGNRRSIGISPGLRAIYAVLFLFVFYFAFLPVPAVVIYGISSGIGGKLPSGWLASTLGFLRNSLSLSAGVTVAATSVGFVLAFTLRRIRFRGRGLLRVLAIVPLINPPFVGTIAYVMLFGKRGLITHTLLGLSMSAFGWQGIFVMQLVNLSTLAYLIISGSIGKADIHLEEAARNLGAGEGRIFLSVTLPMMLPELSSAALLVFLTSMADFSTPLIIGGKFQTLASQLYIQITGLYDMHTASVSGIALLIPCLLAFFAHRRLSRDRLYGADYVVPEDPEHRHLHPAARAAFIAIASCFCAFVAIQYLFILAGAFTAQWGYDYTFTLAHARAAFSGELSPFRNTIRLAVISTAGASFLGILLAYIVRNRQPRLAAAADLFGVLPAAVPGILFGIGYLVVFRYPLFGIGRWWLAGAKAPVLLGTSGIIYLVCIARFLNVGLKSGYALLSHLDRDMENAAYTLGAGEGRTFIRVMLPQLSGAFGTAFIRNFASTMTTLGAIIFLLLPGNKVAVQVIFQIMTGFALGPASVLAVTLSLLSLSLIGFFNLLFRCLTNLAEGRPLCALGFGRVPNAGLPRPFDLSGLSRMLSRLVSVHLETGHQGERHRGKRGQEKDRREKDRGDKDRSASAFRGYFDAEDTTPWN